MPESNRKVRILVIRPWTERLAPLRAALHEAGVDARITRVDIEPAINAALERTSFDFVIFDRETPNITRTIVDARLREHRRTCEVIELSTIAAVVDRIKHALADRGN